MSTMKRINAFGENSLARVPAKKLSVGLQFANAIEEAYTKRKDVEIILTIPHKQPLEIGDAWELFCDAYLKEITGITKKTLPEERMSTLYIHMLYRMPSLVKAKIAQRNGSIAYKLTLEGSNANRLVWYEEFFYFRKNVQDLKEKLGELEGIEKVSTVARWVHEKVVKTKFEVSPFNPETDLKVKSLDLYRGHCLHNKMVAAYVFCDYAAIVGYPKSRAIAEFEAFWNGNPPKTNTIWISRKLYYLDVYYGDDANIRTRQELGFDVRLGHIDKTKCEVFDKLAKGEGTIDDLTYEEVLRAYDYVLEKGHLIYFKEDRINYLCWYLGIDSEIEKEFFREIWKIAHKVRFNEGLRYDPALSATNLIKNWKTDRLKKAGSQNPQADYEEWSGEGVEEPSPPPTPDLSADSVEKPPSTSDLSTGTSVTSVREAGIQFLEALEKAYTEKKDVEIVLTISHEQALKPLQAWWLLCDAYTEIVLGVDPEVLPEETRSTLYIHELYHKPGIAKAAIGQNNGVITYKLTFAGSDASLLPWYEEFVYFRKNVQDLKKKVTGFLEFEQIYTLAEWVHNKIVPQKQREDDKPFNPDTDLKVKSLDLFQGQYVCGSTTAACIFCDYASMIGFPYVNIITYFENWLEGMHKTNVVATGHAFYYLDVYYSDEPEIQTKTNMKGTGVPDDGFRKECPAFEKVAKGQCSIDDLTCLDAIQVNRYVRWARYRTRKLNLLPNYLFWYLGIHSKKGKAFFEEMRVVTEGGDSSWYGWDEMTKRGNVTEATIFEIWKLDRLKKAGSQNPEVDLARWKGDIYLDPEMRFFKGIKRVKKEPAVDKRKLRHALFLAIDRGERTLNSLSCQEVYLLFEIIMKKARKLHSFEFAENLIKDFKLQSEAGKGFILGVEELISSYRNMSGGGNSIKIDVDRLIGAWKLLQLQEAGSQDLEADYNAWCDEQS